MQIDPIVLAKLTPEERAEVDELLRADPRPWHPINGPQSLAYESPADVTGYGGAGGGGKSDLIAGLSLCEHQRVLIVRREKTQTAGLVQRLAQIIGSTDGYSAQNSRWQIPVGSRALIEFGGLDHPGAETAWQGRPHDLVALDEASEMREDQVRYLLAWNRSTTPGQRCRALLTFNPPRGPSGRWIVAFFGPWLDRAHPRPAEPGELRYYTTDPKGNEIEVEGRPLVFDGGGQPVYDFDPRAFPPEKIIKPKSRTFFFAKVSDNPYLLSTDYVSQLQALPEPLRSQLLFGDFDADSVDEADQLVPSAWVDAAMARWSRPEKLPPMDSVGADVARGGKDQTCIARRHGWFFDRLVMHPGVTCIDGPTTAGMILAATRDQAVVHVGVVGIGSSVYDFLRQTGVQVRPINGSSSATALDRTGLLSFRNLRSQTYWRLRELLDPSNGLHVQLPPDEDLRAELCALSWRVTGKTIYVSSRDEVIAKVGRSPDRAAALALALIHTEKRSNILDDRGLGLLRSRPARYDPFARSRQQERQRTLRDFGLGERGYDPFGR